MNLSECVFRRCFMSGSCHSKKWLLSFRFCGDYHQPTDKGTEGHITWRLLFKQRWRSLSTNFIYRVNPTGDVSKCQTKHPTPKVAWNVSVRLRLFVCLRAPCLFFKARLQGSRQGPLLHINKTPLFTSTGTFILERTLYLTSHLIHTSAYIY